MSVNATLAAIPAGLGTILGAGLAFFLFKKTIAKKYGEEKNYSTHAKIKYWCGAVAFFAIAQGFMTVIGEFIFSLMNNIHVNESNLFKASVTIIFYPLIFFVIQLALTFFIKDKISLKSESSTIDGNSGVKSTISSVNFSEVRKTILLIGVLIVAGIVAFRVSPSSEIGNSQTVHSGEYLLSDCTVCKNGTCKGDSPNFIKFFSQNGVVNYTTMYEGKESIVQISKPSAICSFSENNSFSCVTTENYPGLSVEFKNSFDGKDNWYWYNMTTTMKNGTSVLSYQCKAH
jgi:hypothetical protein